MPFVALQMTLFGVRIGGGLRLYTSAPACSPLYHLCTAAPWGMGLCVCAIARRCACAFCARSQELKSRLPVGEDGKPSLLWMLPAGACSGVLAQSITYPGDTVRKLMITNGVNGSPRKFTTTLVRCRLLFCPGRACRSAGHAEPSCVRM